VKKIRDATQIIGMLERGDTAHALSEEISKTLVALQDAASDRAKAKGSVTLVLNISVEGSAVEIEADIKSKLPKSKRGRSFYFMTTDGALSTEHPQQQDMFGGPRERDANVA
jgi:hypothetical protein